MLQLPHPAPTNRQALLHLSLTPFFSSDAFSLSLLHTSPSLSGVRRPACLGMVVVSRLRTAPRLHFICPLLNPAAAPLILYSSQTRLYLSSHFIPSPPSKRPRCSGHQGFTTNSHDPGSTEKQQFAFPSFRIFDCQKNILQFCSRLYSFGIGEIKVSKTKTNIKIKLSKRAPSCFPEVQIVLQVSQRDHHHITIHHSLTPNTKTNTKHKDKHK